jgi:phospholipid/cholesterol/gamma-HCH transport system ATP-binding protein
METPGYQRTILSIDRATFSTGRDEGGGQQVAAHFELYGGELALVRPGDLHMTAALADALSGMLPPDQGNVRFLSRDWRETSADIASAMRGKIGRIFSSGSWLEGFSLGENILLPQLHHTRRPNHELRLEAFRLAEHFGLPGLPTGDPAAYSREDLQRAACVRAFMGEPVLLLLEDPTFGIHPFVLPALINAIRRIRGKGGAVWWMALSDDVWTDATIPADRFFRVTGRNLEEVQREA